MSVTISTTGVKELDRCFKGMTKVLQDNLLKNAHTKAAKPLVDSAKAFAPVGKTKNLIRSIGVERVPVASSGQIGLIQVGPRRKGGFKGFHGHLIEYGKTNRDGVSRSEATPFMDLAFKTSKSEVEKGINFFVGYKIAEYMRQTAPK